MFNPCNKCKYTYTHEECGNCVLNHTSAKMIKIYGIIQDNKKNGIESRITVNEIEEVLNHVKCI